MHLRGGEGLQKVKFKEGTVKTGVYSLLHLLVDFVCALAMFGRFIEGRNGYMYILIYNFCAFALQMPLGALMDFVIAGNNSQCRKISFVYTLLGVILTVAGAFTNPAVLGVGNALFHLGGGVGTIHEDFKNQWKGMALGIFVAPGALGLFIGTILGRSLGDKLLYIIFAVTALMAGLLLMLRLIPDKSCSTDIEIDKEVNVNRKHFLMIILCFLVVIIRSYTGMAVSFDWKTGFAAGLICVIFVVLGKMAGGILAAKFGMKRVIVLSLILAAVCYYFGDCGVFGVTALFMFNMTMPITLYLLVNKIRSLSGFFFGLLTFGLFLGFLPTYFEISLPFKGNVQGAILSIASLVMLFFAVLVTERSED